MYNLLSWIVIGNMNKIKLYKDDANRITGRYGDIRIYKIEESVNEDIFQDSKNGKGSYYGFHGSHFGAWHSILRNGLRVMSQTKYEMNGHVHGNGIYHSPNMLPYYKPGSPYLLYINRWPKSIYNKDYNCCTSIIEIENGIGMPVY